MTKKNNTPEKDENGNEIVKVNITIEELRKKSLFLGVPMYGGNANGLFAKSMIDLASMLTKYGIDFRVYYLMNESLIPRARNYIADEFMRSGCSHLMFIDADIGFDPNDVLTMLALSTQYPEKYDVLTAVYAKKSIAWEKVKMAVEKGFAESNPFLLEKIAADFVFNPVQNMKSFRIDQPLEVSEAGTGFMMITKETLEAYDKAYPNMRYLPDHVRSENFGGDREITAYFHCDFDENRRYLSEDYYFCRKVREIGKKVHICPWMDLSHVGSYTFKGSIAEIAKIGESLTSSERSKPSTYKQVDNSSKPVKISKSNKN